MSETVQLDQLLLEKNSVEDEGKELEEEQRQLKLRAKILTEKIIQELKKRNNNKQGQVNKLQSTVNDLESQLNNLTMTTITEPEPEETNELTETATEMQENAETYEEGTTEAAADDTVSVTEVSDEIELGMDRDKRKRKFF